MELQSMCLMRDAYVDVINKAMDGGFRSSPWTWIHLPAKGYANVGVENYEAGAFGAERLAKPLTEPARFWS